MRNINSFDQLYRLISARKVPFFVVFFVVVVITYAILFAIDFIPEPVDKSNKENIMDLFAIVCFGCPL